MEHRQDEQDEQWSTEQRRPMEHRQDEQDDRWSTDKMSKMHRQDEQDESDGAPTRNTTEGGDGSEQFTVAKGHSEQGRCVGGWKVNRNRELTHLPTNKNTDKPASKQEEGTQRTNHTTTTTTLRTTTTTTTLRTNQPLTAKHP